MNSITLRNIGPHTLIVEYDGKEIIREHFASGESEINHTYNHRADLAPQAGSVDVEACDKFEAFLKTRVPSGHTISQYIDLNLRDTIRAALASRNLLNPGPQGWRENSFKVVEVFCDCGKTIKVERETT